MCNNLYEDAAIYGYDPEDVDAGEFDVYDLEQRELIELDDYNPPKGNSYAGSSTPVNPEDS